MVAFSWHVGSEARDRDYWVPIAFVEGDEATYFMRGCHTLAGMWVHSASAFRDPSSIRLLWFSRRDCTIYLSCGLRAWYNLVPYVVLSVVLYVLLVRDHHHTTSSSARSGYVARNWLIGVLDGTSSLPARTERYFSAKYPIDRTSGEVGECTALASKLSMQC